MGCLHGEDDRVRTSIAKRSAYDTMHEGQCRGDFEGLTNHMHTQKGTGWFSRSASLVL